MKTHTNLSRRTFLANVGAAASLAILNGSSSKGSPVTAAVRRGVLGMDASDPILLAYRDAIRAMQALPSTDPLSWSYQAAIHGTHNSPPLAAWNSCEHGNYYFWSWHRMYLYWFERIVRKMSGYDCWTLPFWDWSALNGQKLPAPFRDITSELYVSNRAPAMNNGTGALPPSSVDYSTAFSFIAFNSASTSLQITPHADVHGLVGGWMGSVPTAAQDPIFYLHHCNIDRLWNLWLAQGGGRSDPVADLTWGSRKFTFFDENGSQVQMTGCEVLRAAEQLGYMYEGEPPQILQYCNPRIRIPHYVLEKRIFIRFPIPPVVLTAETVSISVDIRESRQQLMAKLKSQDSKLLLELDDVEADRPPGVIWEVFVGLPKNAKASDRAVHRVGNISLFGAGIKGESHHDDKPAHFEFPMNRALEAALKTSKESLQITFIPKGLIIDGKASAPRPASPVRVGKAAITEGIEKEQ
jgi:hypothetical protein